MPEDALKAVNAGRCRARGGGCRSRSARSATAIFPRRRKSYRGTQGRVPQAEEAIQLLALHYSVRPGRRRGSHDRECRDGGAGRGPDRRAAHAGGGLRARFPNGRFKKEFGEFLARALSVRVAPAPDGDAWKTDGEPATTICAGRFDHCRTRSILFAIWDGKPARGTGGTADQVAWFERGYAPTKYSLYKDALSPLAPLEPACVYASIPPPRRFPWANPNSHRKARATSGRSAADGQIQSQCAAEPGCERLGPELADCRAGSGRCAQAASNGMLYQDRKRLIQEIRRQGSQVRRHYLCARDGRRRRFQPCRQLSGRALDLSHGYAPDGVAGSPRAIFLGRQPLS